MTDYIADANDYRLATDGAVEVAALSVAGARALVAEAWALIEALWDMPFTVEHERWLRVHHKAWDRWGRRLLRMRSMNDRRNHE